jgi:hypothetical protein
MASVPNRVYPSSEFGEIRTQIVRADTSVITPTATVTSGSFVTSTSSTRTIAPVFNINTTKTVTGSMNNGDFILLSGSGGTIPTIYFKFPSGSGVAVYTITPTYLTGS